MRLRFALVLAFALSSALVPTTASADNRSIARDAYREGTRQFEVGDYTAALESFKKAYVSFEEPAFLFNMAQCNRLLNNKAEALRNYKLFLRKVPAAPNRDEIEKVIAALEIAIEQDRMATSLPPTGSARPGNKGKPPVGAGNGDTVRTPQPGNTDNPTTVSPDGQPQPDGKPAVVVVVPKKDDRPITKRPWFWGVVAGGIVVVGVVVGVAVATTSHPDFKPTLPDVGPAALKVSF